MKKLLSIFLVLILLFSCVACGKTEPTNTNSTTTTQVTTESTTESTTDDKPTTGESTTETTTKEEGTTKAESVTTTTKKEESTTKKVPSTTKKNTTTTTTTKKPENSTTTTTNANPPEVSVVTSEDIAKIKSGFLRLVNEERARMGCGTLKTNSVLTTAANSRSREIMTKFSHTRPNEKPFYTILDPDEYSHYGLGENIQYTSHMGSNSFTKEDLFIGRDDQIVAAYTTIFNNFKNSTGHYENMIFKDYTETGIGISYKIDDGTGMAIFYVVQIFGSGSDL